MAHDNQQSDDDIDIDLGTESKQKIKEKEVENGDSDNPNAREPQTPAEWAKQNGLPTEWVSTFDSFAAMLDRFKDSNAFVEAVQKHFKVEVSWEQNGKIANLYVELRKRRERQSGM